jgi:hypothetical protein
LLWVYLLLTQSMIFAQDAAPIACEGLLPSRLQRGSFARVLPDTPQPVYREPNAAAEVLGRIPPSGIFWVHDGAECADGAIWWFAEYRGLNGWTMESLEGDYRLEPVADEDAPLYNIEGLSAVILFASLDARGGSALFVTDLSGTLSVNLTPPGFDDYAPLVSPDFRTVTFTAYEERSQQAFLGVMGFDGSYRRLMAVDVPPVTNQNLSAAWAPNGASLTFASAHDGDYEIFIINADGSAIIQQTHNSACDMHPTWSPDSTQITFISSRDRQEPSLCVGDVYVMNADGTHPRRLTDNGRDNRTPQWVEIAPLLPPD